MIMIKISMVMCLNLNHRCICVALHPSEVRNLLVAVYNNATTEGFGAHVVLVSSQ